MDLESLVRREKQAWDRKSLWVDLYEDAYSMAFPQKNTFESKGETPGQDKKSTIYDSTLQRAAIKLTSILQSTITPPFTKWAKLVPGPLYGVQEGGIDEEDKIAFSKDLDIITDIIFSAMQISNFDSAASEFYIDLIIGTAAMLVLEGDDNKPFKFFTVPISHIALEDGPDNDIGAVFRRYKKSARAISQMWRDKKVNLKFEEILRETPEKNLEVSEVTAYDPDSKKWDYVVWFNGMDIKEALFVERIYNTNPWIIARWVKVAGEVFGRGPVLNALPDAKTANKAKKLELQNASLATAGVWLAKNNSIFNANAIKIEPGAVIPVSMTGSQSPDLQRLDVGGELSYSQIIQKNLEEAIKDAMYDKEIPDVGGVRSATEWLLRSQELQEEIGAPFGRLHQEFVRPLFNRMIDLLNNSKHIFSKENKELIKNIKLDGSLADVRIIGVLAQAQRLKEIEVITNWASTCISIVGQEVFFATAKVEKIVEEIGSILGIPSKLVRSEAEKAELITAMSQQGGEQISE